MINLIKQKQLELTRHPVYQTFTDLESIRHFMNYHVFAVWDFMSLLKSLQIQLTCVSLPWRPSRYPAEMVRLINQIVLGEESDLDQNGIATSHFNLYLKAMEEINANTTSIQNFVESLDFDHIPVGARNFVEHNLHVAEHGHIVEVAASFFFGREKLIPEMFGVIVDTLKKENVHAPTFLYYLERHIEVDAGEHGPLALKALDYLTQGKKELEIMAQEAGLKALEMRNELWNEVLRAHQDLNSSKKKKISLRV